MKRSLRAGVDGLWGLWRAVAGLWLPPLCPACEADEPTDQGLCDDCNLKLLGLVALRYCPRCAATVGPGIPLQDDGCAQCPQPLNRWRRVVRLGPYAPPLRSAVLQWKFRRQDSLVRRLAGMLAQAVTARCASPPPDLVVPVPSHWLRRLGRGHDQALVLAAALARSLRLPVEGALVRVRNTPPQVGLPRTRRLENVRGAFDARRRAALDGARVLLVDDVTTTGATANEATRTLLAAGAADVTLAVLAKSEPPRAYAQHRLA